eukprot:COSAG01_NODE_277_length_19582_cov_28.126726_4_plen_113_part_00
MGIKGGRVGRAPVVLHLLVALHPAHIEFAVVGVTSVHRRWLHRGRGGIARYQKLRGQRQRHMVAQAQEGKSNRSCRCTALGGGGGEVAEQIRSHLAVPSHSHQRLSTAHTAG